MEFIKQYLKIISYICLTLVFVFASFYLLANLYHYFELKKEYVTNINEHAMVNDIDETLNRVKDNINSFNYSSYNGKVSINKMNLVRGNLEACIKNINNETFTKVRNSNRVTIQDVYDLREAYEDNVLNNCVVGNLYWLTEVDESLGSTYLLNNKEMTTLYIKSLLGNTSYLKKDLLNNSSYYYNTAIASSSVKDVARDGFNEVMDAYDKVAKLVLYVSDWYRMEAEG